MLEIWNLLIAIGSFSIGVILGIYQGFKAQRQAKYQVGQLVTFQQGNNKKKTGVILAASVQKNEIIHWSGFDWDPRTEWVNIYKIDINHGRISYDIHNRPTYYHEFYPEEKPEIVLVNEKDILGKVV